MTFFNSQFKADLYPARKKVKGIKGLGVPIVTVTHPVSTDRPDTVTTSTDGDDAWIEALPWRGAMLTKGVNKDIDGIVIEPFVNNVNRLVSSVNNRNVNKPKDRKAYMKEYMRKLRAK